MSLEFPYEKVLILGATSGIGLALAEKLISNGSHVVAVGRRQGNLDQLQQKHGKEKVSIYQFDVNELDKIPKFVDEYAHPNLRRV